MGTSATQVLAESVSSSVPFLVKLQEQDVKIAALLSKEIVGSVADGDDDSAMKPVNYGSIYELYFAKVAQELLPGP